MLKAKPLKIAFVAKSLYLNYAKRLMSLILSASGVGWGEE